MSLRGRKDRGLSSSTLSEEHQLWHSIRGHLRTLEKLRMNSEGDLIALEQRRKQFIHSSDAGGNGNGNGHDSRDSSLSGMGGAEEGEEASVDVKAAYRKLEGDYQQEQKEIARTLEKVEILMGVVRDSTEPPSSFGKRNKKRRADGRSVSPTPDGAMSPTLSAIDLDGPQSGEQRERKRSNTSKSHSSSGAAAAAASVTATPSGNRRMTSSSSISNNSKDALNLDLAAGANAKDSSYIDPARARREVLAHQLPLKKGRKVAFRQPSKNKIGPGAANVGSQSSASSSAAAAAAAAAAEEDGETWIMATVIECINNDKNRYVVQDEEDPAMPTYNTTLKAVVPLPDHSRTLPPEDYKPGTHVLGLYPDTSCFYRAIVRGGGPGLGGRSTKKVKKPDELLNAYYQLEFEDDEGAIRDVPASLVVERP